MVCDDFSRGNEEGDFVGRIDFLPRKRKKEKRKEGRKSWRFFFLFTVKLENYPFFCFFQRRDQMPARRFMTPERVADLGRPIPSCPSPLISLEVIHLDSDSIEPLCAAS